MVRTKPTYQKQLSADHMRQPPDVVDVPAFVDRFQVLQDVVVVVLGVAILELKQKQSIAFSVKEKETKIQISI
jgi:hypothetical protein